MGLSKRASAVVLCGVGVALLAALVYDIYADWAIQGEALVSTLVENSPPLVLALVLFYITYWLYRNRDRQYLDAVARWSVGGVFGIILIVGWVIGNQTFQSQFKPWVIITHTALGGAVAGAAIGYTTAGIEQSRSKIEAERDRWQSLFENDPSGIADLRVDDGTAIIEQTNSAFRRFFAPEQADLDGGVLTTLVDHGSSVTEGDLAAAIEDGRSYETELTVKAAAGSHFRLRIVPYGIGEDDSRAFAVYTDVTELRGTQQELEEQMHRLEASNERLQQFAYIASHDLQEPLRMVSSYMTLLEDEYRDALDDEAREYIDFAVDGAERMQAMIDGLLEYSRVRTEGKEFTAVDATEPLEDALQALELRIEEVDATVSSDDLPAVEADRSQLSQLFQNLVENAIDHAGEGVTIEIEAESRSDEVQFAVSDDGPGIPESQQDGIFELFEHGGTEAGSTGIGLAICERIVSRHGGNLWVESEEGDGATFYFTLPAAQ